MPETIETYILKLKEKNRRQQQSQRSRLDSKKNIGKRTGKVITNVGGIADVSGLFDSPESGSLNVSPLSIENSIQSKNSVFVRRTSKPPSPPEFSSDEETQEEEIQSASDHAQLDSDSDENTDNSIANKTNTHNRSLKIGTDIESQSFFKSYVNQSTQYSSPRRHHTKKPSVPSHSSSKRVSEDEVLARASDSHSNSFRRYGGQRSSAGESDYASSSPSKTESQRMFEKILSARKGTSISYGSPRDVHRWEDSRTHRSTTKKRSGRDSISKNTPTSMKSNSKILKEYTEMINSAKKVGQSSENDNLLAAGHSKNSTGLLTPRLLSQELTLRRRLSFKDRQSENVSKKVVTLNSTQNVPVAHPLFELDNLSAESISNVLVKSMNESESQTAPDWLYRSVKENHPSLLKRRISSTTKLTNQKSSSKNSPKKSMPRSHQRSRSSITYENSRNSSKKKSHENSYLSPRTNNSSPKFKSKQKLNFNNDSHEKTEENTNTNAKKFRGRPSAKKELNYASKANTSFSKHKKLSPKKSQKIPLRVVEYSSSEESDDEEMNTTNKRTPKSLRNEVSSKSRPRKSTNRQSVGSHHKTSVAKLPRSRRKSKRKSHKFYKSLVENDILHDLENAQKGVSSASPEKLTLDSHKKSNENERSKAITSTSTHKPTAEKNSRKKSGFNKSKNARHDADHGDSTDDKKYNRSTKKKIFHIDSEYSQDDEVQNISLSQSNKDRRSRIYSDSSNSELDENPKILPLKRKVADSNTINGESDPSPPKRKKKENVKNKKKLTADPSPSLQTWLESAGGDHNKKTPVKRPTKNFKSPHVMHSARIEERHKKVHESKPQTEDSYVDQSQLSDHPPLPRVNESSINHTSDDLSSRQHNRVGQGTSRYSMGFGPPASTPRGLKRPKKRIQDESLHDMITNEDTLQPEVNVNEGEGVNIYSRSEDSLVTDDTYSVRKKQRTKRKSSKKSINRKSLKFPNQALEMDASFNLNDNEMVSHEIIEPVSIAEHSISKVESPSRKNQKLSKKLNSVKTNNKLRKERMSKNNSKNNTTLKSVQDAGKGTDGRKIKKPRKNVSKNNTTIKSTTQDASVEKEATVLASGHERTLTKKRRTETKKGKKPNAKKKKTQIDDSAAEETLKSTRKKKNKKKKTFMMAAVVHKSSLPLDIVIPKENDDQGLRRSSRIRTRPLGYGEHFVYDEHYQNIIGIERNHNIIPIDVARETGNVIHLDSMVKIKPNRKKVSQKKKIKQKKKITEEKTSTKTTSGDRHSDKAPEDLTGSQMAWFDNLSETEGGPSTTIVSRTEAPEQNTRNITANTSMNSFINKTISIVDCSTDSVIKVGLTSIFCHDEGLFGNPEVPVFKDDGVWVTKGLSYNGVAQGKLVIQPLQRKCERVAGTAHMCFLLHHGTVDVTIGDYTMNVPKGTYFRVPCKNRYSIYNPHGITPATLFFTMIRAPQANRVDSTVQGS